MMMQYRIAVTALLALFASGPLHAFADVNSERLVGADKEPGAWLTHGRSYAEDRESPLTQINKDNVAGLGLAWYFDT